MAKAKKTKKVATIVLAVAILFAILFALYSVVAFSYKLGYKDGTNNQVLCQAAQKDATLTKLCK